MQLGQEAHCFHRSGVVQGIDGFLNHLFILALIQLALFTTADQQDTFGQDIGHMVQQQRLAHFAFQLTAAQQRADVAIADLIQLLSNR